MPDRLKYYMVALIVLLFLSLSIIVHSQPLAPDGGGEGEQNDHIDLIIDSDNDEGYTFVTPSDDTDNQNSEYTSPGKILPSNHNDANNDGIPDWDQNQIANGHFVPLRVKILDSAITVNDHYLNFEYPSAPSGNVDEEDVPARTLRLWTEQANQTRTTSTLDTNNASGDYIASNVAFELDKLGFTQTIRERTVYIEGIGPSNAIGDIEIIAHISKKNNQTATLESDTVKTTVFDVSVEVADNEVEIHYLDTNNNDKADRRDSGIPDNSTTLTLTGVDRDLNAITMNVLPDGLTTGTLTFTRSGETSMTMQGKYKPLSAYWPDRSRGNGHSIASGTTYTVSQYDKNNPLRIYHEPVYPNTVNTTGTISGQQILKASVDVYGMAVETTASLKQYCVIWNTYYTTPDERDYGASTYTLTVKVSSDSATTTSIMVNSIFKDMVNIEGFGHMRNTYNNKSYLGYYNRSYFLSDNALDSDGGALTNNASAKWSAVSKSVLDKRSTVTIPRLHETMGANFAWLQNSVSEERDLRDTGDPNEGKEENDDDWKINRERWMDVFIPYVARDQRADAYKTMTMTKMLGHIGYVDDDTPSLKIFWVER